MQLSEIASSPVNKKSKTNNERDEFLCTFEIISNDLIQDLKKYNLPQNGIEWIKTMFKETIPGGRTAGIPCPTSWLLVIRPTCNFIRPTYIHSTCHPPRFIRPTYSPTLYTMFY